MIQYRYKRLCMGCLVLLVLLFVGVVAHAQEIMVSGTVIDSETENTLPGVNISVKGTTGGTSTDKNGEFELTVPSEKDTLRFSFVGYRTKEVAIKGRKKLGAIILQSQTIQGEQMVVVGYGAQKAGEVTSSISHVNIEDAPSLSSERADLMLQGAASGVQVRNTDAAPGGQSKIYIRGFSSILGGNEALIVVDGVQGGNLSNINPNDIKNIEVLKDASATAIYGSEGANGVILITTKEGKEGPPQLSYAGKFSLQSIVKKMSLLNAAQYARNVNAMELSNDYNRTPQPIFSQQEIQRFEQQGGTDWQDIMYSPSPMQSHQLALSGGSDVLNYRVSLGYLNQDGVLRSSGYSRVNLRANFSADPVEWLSFIVNWSGSRQKDWTPLYGGQIDWPNNSVMAAINYPPTLPIKNQDGTYSSIPNTYGPTILWNPVASAEEPFIDFRNYQSNLNTSAIVKFSDVLQLKVRGAIKLTKDNNRQFYNLKTFEGRQQDGSASVDDNQDLYYQYQNILTYDNSFNRHNVQATAVTEIKKTNFYSTTINNRAFVNMTTGINDLGGSNIQNTSSNAYDRYMESVLGRINYNYAQRYLVSFSYRVDGSSVFGENNKWAYFPSVSLGWRVSEESFMQNQQLVSNLMIRGSYGETGNQAISAYETKSHINQTGNYPWFGGEGLVRGFRTTSAANPNLKWETVSQTNFGLDLGILNNTFSLSADYFTKDTKDLLMNRELPRQTGLSSLIDNIGSLKNSGVELSLEAKGGNRNEIRWNAKLVYTRSRTTITNLGGAQELRFANAGSGSGTSGDLVWLEEGKRWGEMKGIGYLGTWNTDEAAQAAKYGQLPGDPKYDDINNDGRIDVNDRKVIGNFMPDFTYGFNGSVAYKNFGLRFRFTGSYGNDLFNVTRINLYSNGTAKGLLNRWTPNNQNTDVPALISANTRQQKGLTGQGVVFPGGQSNINSRWIEDASYLRLKALTLSYNVPASLTNRLQLEGLSVNLSAENLFTLTGYSGFDPEVSSFDARATTLGTDFNSYPAARIFSLGINVTF